MNIRSEFIHADGTEKRSGWMNSEEQLAEAMAAVHRHKAKASGFGNETFSVPTASIRNR
jgi:hypothetical protein